MPIPPGAALYKTGTDRELYDHYRDLGLTPELAKQHVELRRTQSMEPAAEPAVSPDLGAINAARIGTAEGLGGAGGALAGGMAGTAIFPGAGTAIGALLGGLAGGASVKPLTEALSSAPASDVRQQWNATVGGHSKAALIGNLVGGLAGGGVASRVSHVMDAAAIRAARKAAMLQVSQRAVAPEADAALRASLTKAGIAPEYLDEAVAAAKKAQAPLPVRPNPLATPAAMRTGSVVQNPGGYPQFGPNYTGPSAETVVSDATATGKKLAGLGKGKTLPYTARGGKAAEEILPGVVSPTQPLPLDRTDPKAIAAALKVQLQNAQNMGLPVSPEQLAKYLHGVSPEVMQQVLKELGH